MLQISLINKRKYPVSLRQVDKIVAETAKKIRSINGLIEIIIVSDSEIRKLNKIWRNINSPTDVLAFAFNEDKKVNSGYLGQIFISYPKIKVQSKEFAVPEKEEFSRILIHGLLHLAGYDHGNKTDAKKMFDLQEVTLKNLK